MNPSSQITFPPISPKHLVGRNNTNNNSNSNTHQQQLTPTAPTTSRPSVSHHHQNTTTSTTLSARTPRTKNTNQQNNNNITNSSIDSPSSAVYGSGGDARITLRDSIREIISNPARYGPLFQCVANEYQFVSSLGEISASEPHFFDALINNKNQLMSPKSAQETTTLMLSNSAKKKTKKNKQQQMMQPSSLFDDDDDDDNNNNNHRQQKQQQQRRVSQATFTAMRSSLGNVLQFQQSTDVRDDVDGGDDVDNNNKNKEFDEEDDNDDDDEFGNNMNNNNNFFADPQTITSSNNNNNRALVLMHQQAKEKEKLQQQQLTTLSRELMTVRRKLAEYQSQRDQFHTTLERTQHDLTSKTNALIKLREVISELTDRDRRKSDRLKELEADNEELRRELGVAQDRARDQVQVSSSKTDPHIERRFREMRIEIGQLQKNLASAEDKIQMLHRENASITDDRDANELRHAEVVRTLEDARAEIMFKDQHIADLNFQNDEKKKWAKLLERFLAETLLYLGKSSFMDVMCLQAEQLDHQHQQQLQSLQTLPSTSAAAQHQHQNQDLISSPSPLSSSPFSSSINLWRCWFLETIDLSSRMLRPPHRVMIKTVAEKAFDLWGKRMVEVLMAMFDESSSSSSFSMNLGSLNLSSAITNNNEENKTEKNLILREQTSSWWFKMLRTLAGSSSVTKTTNQNHQTKSSSTTTDPLLAVSFAPTVFVSLEHSIPSLENEMYASSTTTSTGSSTSKKNTTVTMMSSSSNTRKNNPNNKSSGGDSAAPTINVNDVPLISKAASSLCPVIRRKPVTVHLLQQQQQSQQQQKDEMMKNRNNAEKSPKQQNFGNSTNNNNNTSSSSSTSIITATLIDEDRSVRLLDLVEHRCQVASRVQEYLSLTSKNKKRKSLVGAPSSSTTTMTMNRSRRRDDNDETEEDDENNKKNSGSAKLLQALAQKIPLSYSPKLFPKYTRTDLQKFAIGFFTLRSNHVRAAQNGTFSIHCPTPQDYHVGRSVSLGFCGQYEQLLPFPRNLVPFTVYLNRYLDAYTSSVSSSIYSSTASENNNSNTIGGVLPGGLVTKVDVSECNPSLMKMNENADRGMILGRKLFVVHSPTTNDDNNNNNNNKSGSNNNNSKTAKDSHQQTADSHMQQPSPIESSQPILRLYDCLAATATGACCISKNMNSNFSSSNNVTNIKEIASSSSSKNFSLHSADVAANVYKTLAENVTSVPEGDALLKLFYLVSHQLVPEQLSVDIFFNLDVLVSLVIDKNIHIAVEQQQQQQQQETSSNSSSSSCYQTLLHDVGSISIPLLTQLLIEQGFVFRHTLTPLFVKRTDEHTTPSTTTRTSTSITDSSSFRRLAFTKLEISRLIFALSVDFPNQTSFPIDALAASPTGSAANSTSSANSSLISKFAQEYIQIVLDRFERDRLHFWENVVEPNIVDLNSNNNVFSSALKKGNKMPFEFLPMYASKRNHQQQSQQPSRNSTPSSTTHRNNNNNNNTTKIISTEKFVASWKKIHRRDMTDLELEQLALALSRNLHRIDKISVLYDQQTDPSVLVPGGSGRTTTTNDNNNNKKSKKDDRNNNNDDNNNNKQNSDEQNPYTTLIDPINKDTESIRQTPPELRVLCNGRMHDTILIRCLDTKEAKTISKSSPTSTRAGSPLLLSPTSPLKKDQTAFENTSTELVSSGSVLLNADGLSVKPTSSFNLQTAASIVLGENVIASPTSPTNNKKGSRNFVDDGDDEAALLSQNASIALDNTSVSSASFRKEKNSNNNNKDILPTSLDVISAHGFVDTFYASVHAASHTDEETLTRIHEQLLSSSTQPIAVTPPKPASRRSAQFYNLPPFIPIDILHHRFQTLYSGIFRPSESSPIVVGEKESAEENDQENEEEVKEEETEEKKDVEANVIKHEESSRVRFVERADIESYSLDQKRNQEAKESRNKSAIKKLVPPTSLLLTKTNSNVSENDQQTNSSASATPQTNNTLHSNNNNTSSSSPKQQQPLSKLKHRVNAIVAALSFAKNAKRSVYQVLIEEVVKNLVSPHIHDNDALSILACDRAAAIWNKAFDKLPEISRNFQMYYPESASSTSCSPQFLGQIHQALSHQQQQHHQAHQYSSSSSPNNYNTTSTTPPPPPPPMTPPPSSYQQHHSNIHQQQQQQQQHAYNVLQREMLQASETIFGFSSIEEDSPEYRLWKLKKEVIHYFWKNISQPSVELVEEAGTNANEYLSKKIQQQQPNAIILWTTNTNSSTFATSHNNPGTGGIPSASPLSTSLRSPSSSPNVNNNNNKKLSFGDEQYRAGNLSTRFARYLKEMAPVFAPVSNSAYSTVFNSLIISNHIKAAGNNNNNNNIPPMMITAAVQPQPPPIVERDDHDRWCEQQDRDDEDDDDQQEQQQRHNQSVFGSFLGNVPTHQDQQQQQEQQRKSQIQRIAGEAALLGVTLGRQPPPMSMLVPSFATSSTTEQNIFHNHIINASASFYAGGGGGGFGLNNQQQDENSPTTNINNNINQPLLSSQPTFPLIPPLQFLSTLRDRCASAGRDDFCSSSGGGGFQQQQLQALAQYQQQMLQQGLPPKWSNLLSQVMMTGNDNNSAGASSSPKSNVNISSMTTTGNQSYLATPGGKVSFALK